VSVVTELPAGERQRRGAGTQRLGYELFIAQRYLWKAPHKSFIALISLISILGVIVGVLALTTTLSVFNGFEEEVRSKIVGTNAHVVVLTYDTGGLADYEQLAARLADEPEVVGVAPILYTKAMVSVGSRSDGVVVKGVDLARERQVTDVPDYIIPHIDGIDSASRSGLQGIVVGFEVALRLGASLGDTLAMSSPLRTVHTPLGAVPLIRKFELVGLFHSGMYEYDSSFCYISIPAAQEFMHLEGRATGIELKLNNMYDAPRVDQRLEEELGPPHVANNWIDVNQNLFAWMQLEKRVMFLILLLIILVAAFNICSMLIMVVMDKKRDIGVLRTIGARGASIRRIFVYQGLMVTIIGTVIGCVCGLTLSWAIDHYKLISLPADVYFIENLPVKIDPLDFVIVALATILIGFLATLYPSSRAARQMPVEAIRYQ